MDRNKLSIVFLTSCFWSIVITYFKAHQPLKRIIFCHTYIMIAVTLQFFLAPLVAFEPNGDVSTTWYHFIGTWLHIINGLGLLGVTLFFGYEVLRRKGIPWLFPYLFNNLEAIKADLKQIRSIRFSITDIKNAEKGTRPFIILEQMALPRPHPGGLGPAAQGIGMVLQIPFSYPRIFLPHHVVGKFWISHGCSARCTKLSLFHSSSSISPTALWACCTSLTTTPSNA